MLQIEPAGVKPEGRLALQVRHQRIHNLRIGSLRSDVEFILPANGIPLETGEKQHRGNGAQDNARKEQAEQGFFTHLAIFFAKI